MKVTPIRVGDKFQAEIPAFYPQGHKSIAKQDLVDKKSTSPSTYTTTNYTKNKNLHSTERIKLRESIQRWSTSIFTDQQVVDYLRAYCRQGEIEVGLQCLYEADFDIIKGVQLLNAARRRKVRKQRVYDEKVPEDAFSRAIHAHGKNFYAIQRLFDNVGTSDIVRRFYDWKTTTAYDLWREPIKTIRNRQLQENAANLNENRFNLQQENENMSDSYQSDSSDNHNEYCETCFSRGELLCCDGCERAYHFNCIIPPLLHIPKGDWFCETCMKEQGNKAKTSTSIATIDMEMKESKLKTIESNSPQSISPGHTMKATFNIDNDTMPRMKRPRRESTLDVREPSPEHPLAF